MNCHDFPPYVTICDTSSANWILIQSAAASGRSAVYIVYISGDTGLPYGTPASKGKDEPVKLPTLIFAVLLIMKLLRN